MIKMIKRGIGNSFDYLLAVILMKLFIGGSRK
jgi:hypothetical protein